MINIGGLAIGMAVSFMLLLYVYNEFSFDKFNKNSDRLYRVLRNQPSNGELATGTSTPVPLAAALSKDFPEVDQVTRSIWPYDQLATYQDKALQLNVLAVDPSFLNMFSFDFIAGHRPQALADPSSIVLTQSGAKALFGDKDPVGQTITLSNKYPLKVSAVIKDNPTNSSFTFKALISWDQLTVEQPWVKESGGWGNYSFFTYVMLKPNVSLASVNAKLKNIVTRYDSGQ
jgi:putative ABC transport system permease protein